MARQTSVGRFGAAHGNAAKGGQTMAFEAAPDGVRHALAGTIPELNSRPKRDEQHSKNLARKTVPKTVPVGSG